ncbi:MAG: GGDEF domain-containing protein [Micavibrio aeruginosavorus]|uniref:diguanylate cyclase n=1 Tax=Micavibrio aeruginosavorus TaxID=349221 RepID=A0A2W5N4Z1_9BACT|nr:MAG: GGDEF domain-containing protein [Micavibrio aeruginosavorus]
MQEFEPVSTLPSLTRPERSVLRASVRKERAENEERDLERDGWFRTMSASLALIKQAHLRLDAAESRIADQEARIAELESQVTSDELTGLLNRRGFFNAFVKEMDRTQRGHSHGGLLVLVDLDNFKMIYDTYGHQAGDAALRLVARTLESNSRAMDSCGRIGGDEFVLLLVNTERDKALVRAQNLIKQLNNLSLVWYGAELPIRASLGLKDYGAGDKPEDIFGQADGFLYAQKRSNKGLGPRSISSAF